jgi:hypothetical protein
MQRIYQAANNIEAHMVVHMLEQAGIGAHVQGEHLQSGAGELPLGNLVAVAVADEDVAKAREVVCEWEARVAAPGDREAGEPKKSSGISHGVAFLVGAALSGGLAWAAYHGPDTSEGLDHNGDGKVDERFFYDGGRLSRIETDRDFEGRVDLIYKYDRHGNPAESRSDDDFDGNLESVTHFRNGQPLKWQADWDGDGQPDMRSVYEHGVIAETEYLDRSSRRVVKTVTYRGGKAERAELDLDGDGGFERGYDLDAIDEPIAR